MTDDTTFGLRQLTNCNIYFKHSNTYTPFILVRILQNVLQKLLKQQVTSFTTHSDKEELSATDENGYYLWNCVSVATEQTM